MGNRTSQVFKHNIQLQVHDSQGFPIDGTQFWVTIDIFKEGDKIHIHFPVINFVIPKFLSNDDSDGRYDHKGYERDADGGRRIPGGYIKTVEGFLPENVRPNTLVPQSFLISSNNGMSLSFSFNENEDNLPRPPTAYKLEITNCGAVVIKLAGTYGNIIPPGSQIVLPTHISYIVMPKVYLNTNHILSLGPTITTTFSDDNAANDGIRDTHINDAYNGLAVWAWTDNSNIVDKTNNVLNVFVAIIKTNSCGLILSKELIQLTDFPPNVMAWDTAVAINRSDSTNIVVSYGIIDHRKEEAESTIGRSVLEFKNNKWTVIENGEFNLKPSGFPIGVGDATGVASDKFGNIWYCYTNLHNQAGNVINQIVFAVSTNRGLSFNIVFEAPIPEVGYNYDLPEYSFGNDDSNQYGLYFSADYMKIDGLSDYVPYMGFIPISGVGQFGQVTHLKLTGLLNISGVTSIASSDDGRIWRNSLPITGRQASYNSPLVILYKSPGPLDENWAGAWDYAVENNSSILHNLSSQSSQPSFGYTLNSARSILYDNDRQALYIVVAGQEHDDSPNMQLYFIISRNNGQTWSHPINVRTSNKGNCGYQSMQLDPITRSLAIGWYDGRNDPTYQAVEYMCTIIPAYILDVLVQKIPLSNPIYKTESVA